MRDDPSGIAWQVHFHLETLRALCGLTDHTLRYRWLHEFGCPPKEWLMRLRAIEAGNLAEQGRKTEHIAALLGYTDASHCARDFRRFYGMTTYQWRELCRWEPRRAAMIRARINPLPKWKIEEAQQMAEDF